MSKRFTNPNKIKSIQNELLYENEIFIDVTDSIIPGVYDYYQISNYGRIFHKYLGIFLKPGINGGGYYFVIMSTIYGPKAIQIHRLVMLSFNPIPNPNDFEVNHKDGNKLNPLLSNLEWKTHQENIQLAYDTGLHHKNENSFKTKLSNDIVIEICKMLQTNCYTNQEIANIVGNGVTINIVSSIKQRQSWIDISKDFDFYSRPRILFTKEMVEAICNYFQDNNIGNKTINEHCKNALQFNGFDCSARMVDSVRKIYTRKYYTIISCNYNF